MKECAYCGRENEDHAVACRECGTDSFKGDPPKESDSLPELDAQEHLVTLTTCQNLMNAHLLVSRLAAAGIEALIPDEFLMQNVGFSLNTYGYVRVQVRQKDYSQARSILSGSDQDVVGSQQSQIRIVGVPPGEAPESIREQWVGLDLPLAPGFSTACNTETCGVVSGKTDEKQVIGYVVDIEDAMIVLGRKSPEAVSWWREHATHLFCEGGKLIFDDYVCELIKNDDA